VLYNAIAGKSRDRLEALSDGLFAFAMTLLVLDLRVPSAAIVHGEANLQDALLLVLPRIVPYLMSFMTLGIFWIGQQTQLNALTRTDRNLTWINLAFLLPVTFVPFTTSLLAEFLSYRTALFVYWLNIFLLGLFLYFSWTYARHAGLIKDDINEATRAAVDRRIFVAQGLYALGAALAFVNTYWSIAAIVLIQLNYVIAPRVRWLYRL
jgi:uncharacterized membrane protein